MMNLPINATLLSLLLLALDNNQLCCTPTERPLLHLICTWETSHRIYFMIKQKKAILYFHTAKTLYQKTKDLVLFSSPGTNPLWGKFVTANKCCVIYIYIYIQCYCDHLDLSVCRVRLSQICIVHLALLTARKILSWAFKWSKSGNFTAWRNIV